MTSDIFLSLVIPVLNEEESVGLFYKTVRENETLKAYRIELIFVDDGSSDGTPELVRELCHLDKNVVLIRLTRNFGKEAAILAGIEHARGDAAIPIDVDLQDPIEVVPRLVDEWKKGAEVVLAKRCNRSTDSWPKKKSAQLFYRFYNRTSKPRIEENVGDFRLLSRRAVDTLTAMPERNLFMKGLLSWAGYRYSIVEYTRSSRAAGNSKFNGWKLWNLAMEGITSFSTLPLRVWTYVGSIIALLSFLYASAMIVRKLLWGISLPGYPSLIVVVLFLGGVQLVGIGILGEYIGRIYIESKRRPRYIVEESINWD